MALTDNGNGLSAADVAAVVGNNGGGFGNGFWGRRKLLDHHSVPVCLHGQRLGRFWR